MADQSRFSVVSGVMYSIKTHCYSNERYIQIIYLKKKKRALLLDQYSKAEDMENEVSDLILGEKKSNQCLPGC